MLKSTLLRAVAVTFCMCLLWNNTYENPRTNPKILFVVADGLRWDYVSKSPRTKYFDYMARTGVRARCIPSYPTYTIPNLGTMGTGVHPETHGLVANRMYDPITGQRFRPTDMDKVPLWLQSEHISVTALKHGKKFSEIIPVGPQAFKMKENSIEAVRRITTNEADILVLYFPVPDFYAQYFGADPHIIEYLVKRVDDGLGTIFKELRRARIINDVNVVVVGDHGLVNTPLTNGIDIQLCLGNLTSDVIVLDMNVHVITTKHDEVYTALSNCNPNMKVYRRDSVPVELNYRNNARIGDFVLVYEYGWFGKNKLDPLDAFTVARHNLDPTVKDMHGAFFARGPHFRCNECFDPMQMVDLYGLTCKILNIPAAPNNGTFNVVGDMLRKRWRIGKSCYRWSWWKRYKRRKFRC